ncbi:MAG: aminodeoxychorismate synthase component I [Nitrospirae bacterium]|nr:aminodeoxychorismate synthase component I [Nitrospirota bacterium]
MPATITKEQGTLKKVKPVFKEFPIGDHTPLSVYEKVKKGKHSFLLESINGTEATARYSFIGTDPFIIFKSRGEDIELTYEGKRLITRRDPLTKIRELINNFRMERINELPPFFSGAVGFFSYDLVHSFENLPAKAKKGTDAPDIYLILTDNVIAFDHVKGTIAVIMVPGARHIGFGYNTLTAGLLRDCKQDAEKRVEEIIGLINSPPVAEKSTAAKKKKRITPASNMTKEEYMSMVKRCKEYIAAGDIYQANLSQRLTADIGNIKPIDLYRALREINPSPFSALLEFGDIALVSSSPERLIKLDGDNVETRPIAGTRPRGKTELEDRQMHGELIANEKERAEHIMLIDLERNDIGRACEYGSVQVDEFMTLEDYSHVIHIASNIRGKLRKDMDCLDLIKAVFPGGTITGVPKIRCMEIIDELEPVARGPYTGSIGYISLAGDMDLNIIIRTFIIKDGRAHVQVGAGIVADSDPEKEYYETLHKAEALLKVLEKI